MLLFFVFTMVGQIQSHSKSQNHYLCIPAIVKHIIHLNVKKKSGINQNDSLGFD